MSKRKRIKNSTTKQKVDELIRKSRPYFLLEKQTRILEVQNNRLVVINGHLGKHIMDLEQQLETYRAQERAKAQGLTAEQVEAERQARLAKELEEIPEYDAQEQADIAESFFDPDAFKARSQERTEA